MRHVTGVRARRAKKTNTRMHTDMDTHTHAIGIFNQGQKHEKTGLRAVSEGYWSEGERGTVVSGSDDVISSLPKSEQASRPGKEAGESIQSQHNNER